VTQEKSPTACDGRASEANPKNSRAQCSDFASQLQTDVVEAANLAYAVQALRTRAKTRRRNAAAVTVTDHKPPSGAASNERADSTRRNEIRGRGIEPRSAMSAPSVGYAPLRGSTRAKLEPCDVC
jgi:hypothetical protein